MRELIERLEKAEGPDAELDKCIMMAVDYKEYERRWWAARPDDIAARYMSKDQQKQMAEDNWIAPPYTASIDAALTLAPEGLDWRIDTMTGLPGAIVCQPNAWFSHKTAPRMHHGKSPALALCIAALKPALPLPRNVTPDHRLRASTI